MTTQMLARLVCTQGGSQQVWGLPPRRQSTGTPLELADTFPTQSQKLPTTLAKFIPRADVNSGLQCCRNVLGLLAPFSPLPFQSLLAILVFHPAETRLEVTSCQGVRKVQGKTFSSENGHSS